IVRSSLPIVVQRPDVAVAALSVPVRSIGGQPLIIQYDVKNVGKGSVFNATRKDRIYVSTSPVFDAAAQLLATQSFSENILSGSAVTHGYSYTFPPGTSGARYFFVHTNFDSTFRETTYTNNRSEAASTTVSTAV